jgi:protein SERAC1
MGGLVVKELLYQAKLNNYDNFLNNTVGLVCISLLCFVIVSSVNRI